MRENRHPINLLEQLLFNLISCEDTPFGRIVNWKHSRHFDDFSYAGWEAIEAEFSQGYELVVSQIQEAWGQPAFRGNPESTAYPKWFRIWAIEMCYWVREEGIAYVAFHREDRELPYSIDLGVVTEDAIEEMSELD